MKKALIGTSALIAVGLLNVGAAQAADKIQLKVGGFYNAGIGAANEDDGAGEAGEFDRGHAVLVDSEVTFSGSTTLDNGIEVGVTAELEITDGARTDPIDEHYIWIENMDVWGRIEMGDRDGAEGKTMVIGPVVNGVTITGLTTFQWRNSALNNEATGPVVLGGLLFIGDSTKVTYYTPRFSGLQLGVSYTPDLTEDNKALAVDSSTGGTLTTLGEGKAVGANWTGSFGDASVSASAGWSSAEAEDVNRNDRDQWSLGINIAMNGWSFGGGYVNDETNAGQASTTQQFDNIHYRLGLVYAWGAYTAGLEYANQSVDTATGEDEAEVWSLQAKRNLGAGISMGGGLRMWDWSDADGVAASEHDATEFFFVTSVTF